MNNKENVTIGSPRVSGAIFIGNKPDAVLPADADTAIGADFTCIGYASEDGVSFAEEKESDEKKAWGGVTVRTSNTSYAESATFTPIETSVEVARLIYGDGNVEVTSDGGKNRMKIKHNGKEMPKLPLVVETIAGDGILKRYVCPSAQVTTRGDLTLNGTDLDGRELTFKLYEDKDGNTMYEHVTTIAAAGARGRR